MWSKSRSCIWRQLWLNVWHLARNLQLQSFQFWILTYGQSQSCNISSWLSLRKRPTRLILGGRIKILWTCHIISHLRGGTSCRLRVSQKNLCRHWASSVPSWDCVVRARQHMAPSCFWVAFYFDRNRLRRRSRNFGFRCMQACHKSSSRRWWFRCLLRGVGSISWRHETRNWRCWGASERCLGRCDARAAHSCELCG